ncbi:PhoD-like phosphatase N-terminal domain-containing protein [Archangium primigenium]|uniref:PhoD-like phosphatase N-terminal domain-containing protein n=1 Tax=[Archangium] primigenium TaxID=2792470 RepID=UPI00195ACBC1|nr:PhoD-like phosphatase N-terminal domain-containing protein [Archangium primigenium]
MRALDAGPAYFPQAVASGEPGAHEVVLWTRVVDPLEPGARLSVSLQVAQDADFTRCVVDVTGLVPSPERDHTLKVRVTRLEPGTCYHYRFLVERDGQWRGSACGRTRTGTVSPLTRPLHFTVARYQDLLGARASRLDGDEPEFILFLGDSLREAGEAGVAAPSAAPSVSRYRAWCRAYRARSEPRRWHSALPLLVLWEEARCERWRAVWRALCDYLPVDPFHEAVCVGGRTAPIAHAA